MIAQIGFTPGTTWSVCTVRTGHGKRVWRSCAALRSAPGGEYADREAGRRDSRASSGSQKRGTVQQRCTRHLVRAARCPGFAVTSSAVEPRTQETKKGEPAIWSAPFDLYPLQRNAGAQTGPLKPQSNATPDLVCQRWFGGWHRLPTIICVAAAWATRGGPLRDQWSKSFLTGQISPGLERPRSRSRS
jgi:hypothetical protein